MGEVEIESTYKVVEYDGTTISLYREGDFAVLSDAARDIRVTPAALKALVDAFFAGEK